MYLQIIAGFVSFYFILVYIVTILHFLFSFERLLLDFVFGLTLLLRIIFPNLRFCLKYLFFSSLILIGQRSWYFESANYVVSMIHELLNNRYNKIIITD